MFLTIYSQLVLAAAILVVTFSFIKGGEPERMGAAAYAMVFLAVTMIKDGTSLNFPRWGVMGMEIVLLIVLIGIAWHSRRACLGREFPGYDRHLPRPDSGQPPAPSKRRGDGYQHV